MLILNAGNILTQDYTKILLMMNATNKTELQVISTYVYEVGIVRAQSSYSTAVNLLVSLVSLVLVISTNLIVKKIDPEQGLW